MRHPGITKLRIALAAVLTGAVLLGPAAHCASAATPAANDSADETVYLIKGYGQDLTAPANTWSCATRWRKAISAMHRRHWTGQLVRVGFYRQDTSDEGCDVNLTERGSGGAFGTQDTPLRELGRRLAWNIYNVYSRKGKSIDIVGHSMGGLIARAAIAGYARHEPGWPPVLHVEDVVTLGTPHDGTLTAAVCFTRQCKDMRHGSDFIDWLAETPNPQAAGGTDWTLIGAYDDGVAPPGVSTPGRMHARHLVIYPGGQGLDHSALRKTVKGRFRMSFVNDGRTGSRADGASPIQATQNSLFWARRW
jgi:hypothetical protein